MLYHFTVQNTERQTDRQTDMQQLPRHLILANLRSPCILVLEPIEHVQDLLTCYVDIRNLNQLFTQLTPRLHRTDPQTHQNTVSIMTPVKLTTTLVYFYRFNNNIYDCSNGLGYMLSNTPALEVYRLYTKQWHRCGARCPGQPIQVLILSQSLIQTRAILPWL